MGRISCAVLGATGMVGSRFVKALMEHPWFSLDVMSGSEASQGRTLRDASQAAKDLHLPGHILDTFLVPPDPEALADAGVEVVFSAMPADVAGPLESRLTQVGISVFSNARSHRRDPHVPVLVPEVNPAHLGLLGEADDARGGGFIVCNSNCTTAGLVLALAPLVRFGIEGVFVASYQALSGAGLPGPSAFDLVGNVLPHIAGEEEKVRDETLKIMGTVHDGDLTAAPFEVHPTCVRVPTAHGHLLAMQVRLREEVDEETVRRTIHTFTSVPQQLGLPSAPERPLIMRLEPDRPQPRLDLDAGGPGLAAGMAVSVGRMRVEGRHLRMLALAHNLVRGAAGGSVLNAELAHAYRYI